MCVLQKKKMVSMSRMSSSHVIGTEVLQSKHGYTTLFSGLHNKKAVSHKLNFAFPFDSSKTTQNMHVGEKFRRGSKVVVAASPPTEDAAVATEPLTKEDLVGYLASGCKPKENWRFISI